MSKFTKALEKIQNEKDRNKLEPAPETKAGEVFQVASTVKETTPN